MATRALYVNGHYKQTNDLPPTSNSFFDFSFDTKTVSNGPTIIMAKAFDTSGNAGSQALVVLVSNPSPGVGGIIVPIDKFDLLAPYFALAVAVVAATIGAVYARKRWSEDATVQKP